MTSRIIQGEADRDGLILLLKQQQLPFTVDITKGKRRSVAQNRTQRMWLNEISEQLGDRTAEEIRGEAKLTCGVPILRAENEAFRKKYDRLIKPLPYEAKLELMMMPIDFPVTRLMSTNQKTRYLDAMAKQYGQLGVVLTQPEVT